MTTRRARILLVSASVRTPSLTHDVATAFADAARSAGHAVEFADLMAEGFDPVLREADEPDWKDLDKVYSGEVRAEIARIVRNDATVMVFPVWWWTMPALMKGWIDRVWNHGFAYGGRSYPHKRVLLIGIAGNSEASFAKRGYDSAMQVTLKTGLLDYCGVEDGRLVILYSALEAPAESAQIIEQARILGSRF